MHGGTVQQRGQEERLHLLRQPGYHLPRGVYVQRVAARVEHALARADAGVVLRRVEPCDETGTPPSADFHLHRAQRIRKLRAQGGSGVGQVALVDDARVVLQVVRVEGVGETLEEAGDDAGAGKDIHARQAGLPGALQHLLHARADEIQQGALVAQVGDDLFRQVRRVLRLWQWQGHGECSGSALAVFQRGGHQAGEERMRRVRAALELRVVLAGDEEGVVRQLHHFHQPVLVVHGGDD